MPKVSGVTGILPSPLFGSCKVQVLKGGQGIPMIFSADLMLRWSLFMSFFVAAPNQTEMEVQRMD